MYQDQIYRGIRKIIFIFPIKFILKAFFGYYMIRINKQF